MRMTGMSDWFVGLLVFACALNLIATLIDELDGPEWKARQIIECHEALEWCAKQKPQLSEVVSKIAAHSPRGPQ